jgi:hypothetical protein
MLVSVEIAADHRFLSMLLMVKSNGRLLKVFIDEIHLYLEHQSFRPSVSQLKTLKNLPVPTIGLSGTIVKNREHELEPVLGRHFWSIRSTDLLPKNVTYCVNLSTEDDLELSTAKLVAKNLKNLQTSYSRVICYAMTVNEVFKIYHFLLSMNVPVTAYTSQMTDLEQKNAYSDWINGKSTVMVATSGFSVGIDYPYVKFVIINGFAYSISSFLQQSGRAARKSGTGICILNTSEQYIYRITQIMESLYLEEKYGYIQVLQYIRHLSCRRNYLMITVDNSSSFCSDDISMAQCDVCQPNLSNEKDTDFQVELKIVADKMVTSLSSDNEASTIPYVPQNTFSVIPTIQQASEDLLFDLCLHARDFLDNIHHCIICSTILVTAGSEHTNANCQLLKSRCFICLRRSCGSNCSLKVIFTDTANICYGCGLTLKQTNELIHSNPIGAKCPNKCVLTRFCWIIWYLMPLRQIFDHFLKSISTTLSISSNHEEFKQLLGKSYKGISIITFIIGFYAYRIHGHNSYNYSIEDIDRIATTLTDSVASSENPFSNTGKILMSHQKKYQPQNNLNPSNFFG